MELKLNKMYSIEQNFKLTGYNNTFIVFKKKAITKFLFEMFYE